LFKHFLTMKSGQITIKDIARELQISPSTVSRALKNHPDISQETKKAVMELANKLEYQPNSIALSLRKSKTNMLGIVVPRIVHHFFSSIISGIEDVAYDEGYNVIITQSNESYQREIDSVFTLVSSRVDGLLMSLSSETQTYEHLKAINKRNIPLVFFDRATDEALASQVLVDDHDGAFLATEHLIEQGCRQIVHLEGPEKLLISQNRLQGYKDALLKYDLPFQERLIIQADNFKTGYDSIKSLIQRGVAFDGVFTTNDDTAMGAMKAIKDCGKKIPSDVAVIGFGDDPYCNIAEPNLSSISQPGFEMGQTVARLFLDQLHKNENEEEFTPEIRILKTKLVVRESTMRKV
jgi:LacI family transcriptional regulator